MSARHFPLVRKTPSFNYILYSTKAPLGPQTLPTELYQVLLLLTTERSLPLAPYPFQTVNYCSSDCQYQRVSRGCFFSARNVLLIASLFLFLLGYRKLYGKVVSFKNFLSFWGVCRAMSCVSNKPQNWPEIIVSAFRRCLPFRDPVY